MKTICCVLLLIFCSLTNYAQDVTINGYVKDATNGEALMYSTCYDSISRVGVSSNSMGYFNLQVDQNEEVVLKVSFLGYQSQSISIIPTQDTTLNFLLKPKQQELVEVVVREYASIQKKDVLGKVTVPQKTIQSIPSFAGVPDLMKAITFIPGVSGGREGYSNIYVRGGDRGQNLVLLDGIKLYNTNHVGGFLSLLNSNILKHVDVYKGGFPARYGGRASSVIDVYSKDGDRDKIRGKFNLGVLNSGLVLEGPVGKQLSFYVAGRTSYYNFLNNMLTEPNDTWDETFKYSIYDVNSKLTWQKNNYHKLSLSFFTGSDIQTYYFSSNNFGTENEEENSGMSIHTSGVSLLYRGRLSQKVFTENLIAYSNYNNDLYFSTIQTKDTLNKIRNVDSFSYIDDYSFKNRIDFYQSNKYTLRAGIETSYYRFKPGVQNNTYLNENTNVINDTTIGFKHNLESVEVGVYQENEIDIAPDLRVNIGIRGVNYFCDDTSFFKLEPRVSMRWLATKNLSVKANFTIINQFNHVLVNNVDGLEREIWFSATKEFSPQQSKQASVGVFFGKEDWRFDSSIEAFYKKMYNLQEYRSPVMDENSLDNISNIVAKNGIGIARGFEFYVKKDYPRLSLNLNYTLSWSDRQFDALNNGDWFPFLYDRRHDFSFVTLYHINKKYSVSSNFMLNSGAVVTLPVGFSKHDDLVYQYFIYESMNNRRLPLYHRLDLGIARKDITKNGNISNWSLNVFNVYARQNPVFIYYDSNTGKTYQKSLFSIIPTINYSFEF